MIYIFLVVVFNLVFYVPVFIETDLTHNNSTGLMRCDFIDLHSKHMIHLIDLSCRSLIPFIIMAFCSILLLFFIFKNRYTSLDCVSYHINVKFSFSLIFINLICIFYSLPLSVCGYYSSLNQQLDTIYYYIYYLSFSFKFYFLLMTNYEYRKQFFILFK